MKRKLLLFSSLMVCLVTMFTISSHAAPPSGVTLIGSQKSGYVSLSITYNKFGTFIYTAANTNYIPSNTPPTFTNSSPQALTVCQNASAISINSLLTVSDVNFGQTETWSVTTSPSHGTLGGFTTTKSSGSTSITPTGLTYTPTSGYSGSDQFVIRVSDGAATASMTVNVTVAAAPNAGTISGTQEICTNGTTTFTSDGTAGGVWTSDASAYATVVSETGVISGVAAGSSTITYTVRGTAGCFSDATATRTVTVNAIPNAGTLTGIFSSCATTFFSVTTNGTSGGIWTMSNPSGYISTAYPTSATIGAFPKGNSTATSTTAKYGALDTLSYTVTSNGCSAATSYAYLNFLPLSDTGIVSGASAVCTNATTTFTSNSSTAGLGTFGSITFGGSWKSGNTSIFTVDANTGVATGIAAGSAYIQYAAKGCGTFRTTTKRLLTVKAPTPATITQAACGSYSWHGNTYTTSGAYTFDSLNAAGCDSLTTLNLTITQPTTATVNHTACGSYAWHGNTYTTSGTYTFDSLNAAGCDSLTTLNLTITQPTTATVNHTACGSYLWHGTTYTASGTYTFDSLNAAGCDSLTTLNLTITQPTTATVNHTACGSYAWHGNTYTTSGAYTFDSLNAAGCDSLTTLNLTIKQPTTSSTSHTAFGSYTWNGSTYNTSGTYTAHLSNAAGCDSTATLVLTITNAPAPTITSFTPTSTCPGATAAVTVFGSNFTGATAVTIGGTPASYFVVDSASTLKVVVPANATGALAITTANGTVTSDVEFSNSSLVTANAYVANSADGTVSVINTATNTVSKTLTVGSNPYAVSVTPDGKNVYVTNGNSGTVSVISTTSNTVTSTITVGTNPYGITASPDGTKIYVTNNGSNSVSIISTATNTVSGTVTVGTNPYGVIVSPDNSKVYVVNGTSNSVSVIDAATNTITTTVSVGHAPRRIGITPDGTRLYVSNSTDNTVSVIDMATHSVTATIPVGNTPLGITVSLDGAKVYVADVYSNDVRVINTATSAVVSTIAVGTNPFGISLSPDGTKIYAVNSGSASVSVINAATNTVTTTVSVGRTPISFGNFVANILSACALPNIWTGAVSTDWFNASNWTIGVPTSNTDGIIPAAPANQPVIASGTALVDNMIIESGAKLTNNATFNVFGNFADTGRFVSAAGSHVVLMGGIGIVSGVDTFANLDIRGDYAVGSTSNDRIYIKERLIKTSGVLTTNNKLTLLSDSTATALIQDNGGILSGKAYIQHYASGNFGYHHFSSPVSGATVNSWSNAFPITGPDGAPSWLSNWGSLQYYDEEANTTAWLDSSYFNYTALSNALTPGQGYTAWLNSLPTLNTYGTPNNGAISIPVTHTAGTNDPKGWNFVGNPYPSPISWSSLKALNPGLFGDASCYLWKASGTGINGTWTAYDGTVGVNGAGDVINSSLGFFVYVNNSGTLNFNNSVRTYTYTSPEIFGAKSNAVNMIRLSIKDAVAKTTDEAVVYTSYRESFSKKMAQPAGATNATIAFDVKGTKAAINVLRSIDSKTELPITLLTPKAGTYAISLNTKNIDLPVYLKDAVTGTYTDLSANATVTVTTSAKETAGRYSLVFKQSTVDRLPITVYPNPAKSVVTVKGNHIASVQVIDNLGRVVKVVSAKDAMNPAISVNGLPAGVYQLKIQSTDGKVSSIGMVKE